MWYFEQGGSQQGPVTDEQIRTMIRSGSLRRENLVWRDGMSDWQPAGDVLALEFSGPPAYQPPPPPPTAASSPYAPPQSVYTPPPPVGGSLAIPNYLPWAIAATLLCCLPGGVASIIYASRANSARDRGDYAAAAEAAKQAKMWLTLSVVFGLLIFVISIISNLANLNK